MFRELNKGRLKAELYWKSEPVMIFCPNCSSEVSTSMEFCSRCGTRLSTAATSTPTPQATVTMESGLTSRMIRALKAESRLYEEVEHDPNATRQVLLVIGMVAVAQAIGIALENLLLSQSLSGILAESIIGFVLTVTGIALWSYLLYFFGTKLFQGKATPQEVWRAAGFARSPGVFYIIPFVGRIAFIWMIYTNIIAARQALDLTTRRAILASIVSLLPYIFIIGFIELAVSAIF